MSKDYLDKWEERQKQNIEKMNKTKMSKYNMENKDGILARAISIGIIIGILMGKLITFIIKL